MDAGAGGTEGARDDAGARVDADAVGQVGGAVGQGVGGVGIASVGIEADDGAFGVGAVGELGAEHRGHVDGGSVTVQVKESVSVEGAVADGEDDRVDAGAGGTEGARDDAGARVDADAVGQVGGAVGQRVTGVGIAGVGIEADERAFVVRAVGELGAEDGASLTAGSVTVQVKESVSSNVPSLTVRTTLYTPELVAPSVPETTPVEESIEMPSGRLVAEYVRVSAALASLASASKLMSAPSSSERSPNDVLNTGATLGSITVQVKLSVSVSVSVADGQDDRVDAGAGGTERARDDARRGVDRDPVGQVRGGVREGVGRVGIRCVGIEADGGALVIGAIGELGAEDRGHVGLDDGPGERVGVREGAVGDGQDDCVDAGAGGTERAADDAGATSRSRSRRAGWWRST